MLTSKQRSNLKSIAASIEPVAQVGKAGIGENMVKSLSDALEARELIKVNILTNAEEDAKTTGAQLAAVDWGAYADIVFLSKSLGTVVAARSLRQLGVAARSLYLTPLAGALAAIRPGDTVLGMVSGGADSYIDWHLVRDFCAGQNLPFLFVPGAGHRLTIPDDAAASEEYARKILEMLALF